QAYFGYRTGPRQRVHIADGRAYIEQAHREGRQYDMVMLDAFDVDYIPRHLMTLEFLRHVRAILAPGGIVVANTFTNSRLYASESATYAAVFGPFFNLREGNRVIVAGRDALPGLDRIAAQAKALQGRLQAQGIYEAGALGRFAAPIGGPAHAQLLRDPPAPEDPPRRAQQKRHRAPCGTRYPYVHARDVRTSEVHRLGRRGRRLGIFRQLRHGGVSGEDQAGDRRGILQRGTR